MTREELTEKCKELFEQVSEHMPKDLEKLLDSGAVDWETAENNYLLPRKIICAILMHEQWEYKPLSDSRKEKREIINYYAMI